MITIAKKYTEKRNPFNIPFFLWLSFRKTFSWKLIRYTNESSNLVFIWNWTVKLFCLNCNIFLSITEYVFINYFKNILVNFIDNDVLWLISAKCKIKIQNYSKKNCKDFSISNIQNKESFKFDFAHKTLVSATRWVW